ncbi:MAG: DUF3187 family protein [Planctomycetes bacterium]|nr:DUF3187 family protein [Planctomycetota bacterium]
MRPLEAFSPRVARRGRSTPRRRAAAHVVVAGVVWCAALGGCASAPGFGGPLPVRNQHPVFLTTLAMDPAPARVRPAGTGTASLGLAYSSMFLRSEKPEPPLYVNRFEMDGELLRAGLRGEYGFGGGLQLAFELPFASTSGGFLDRFVEDFHDTFNQTNGGREKAAYDQFGVRVDYQGRVPYQMEERGFEPLDVPIELRWAMLPLHADRPVGLTARAAVELPVGDQSRGYGNGGLDSAVGMIGEAQWGPFAATAHVDYTFVSTPDRARRAGIHYRGKLGFGAAVEAAITDATELVVQLEMSQSPIREVRAINLDSDQWLLWVGLRSQWTRNFAVELALGEDMTLNGPPDFTVFLGCTLRFGAPGR